MNAVTTGIIAIVFGLIGMAFGVRAYLGRGPFVFTLPGGFGFTLVGLGIVLTTHPISDFLIVAGMAFCGFAILLVFWQPRWMRPS